MVYNTWFYELYILKLISAPKLFYLCHLTVEGTVCISFHKQG